MKKIIVLAIAICSMVGVSSYSEAQSITDILNALGNKVSSLTGKDSLTMKSLVGTWTYQEPAMKLQSNNVLKDVAGTVAIASAKSKLIAYYKRVGIVAGSLNYVFKTDSTFSNKIRRMNFVGNYTVNMSKKQVVLHYSIGGVLNYSTLTGWVDYSGNSMSLLFDGKKLLKFLSLASSVSNNSTLKVLNEVAKQYDGLLIGFQLKK